jgi:hypothetical protein
MIMVDARNVSMLSSDITGHNRIGSRDRPASERRTTADRRPHRPPTPLSPAATTRTSNEAHNFGTTGALSNLANQRRRVRIACTRASRQITHRN